jgi:hypothetical protein
LRTSVEEARDVVGIEQVDHGQAQPAKDLVRHPRGNPAGALQDIVYVGLRYSRDMRQFELGEIAVPNPPVQLDDEPAMERVEVHP